MIKNLEDSIEKFRKEQKKFYLKIKTRIMKEKLNKLEHGSEEHSKLYNKYQEKRRIYNSLDKDN